MTEDGPRGRANFRLIADQVRNRIATGSYPPSSRLPTEDELAEEFDTNRGTAAQSLRLLVGLGLVTKSRRGTFVHRIVTKITRDGVTRFARSQLEEEQNPSAFDSQIRELGMTPTYVTETRHVQPPAWVADLLKMDAHTESTVALHRRALADDIPIESATSYRAELDHPQSTITEDIEIRTPTAEEIAALDMREDQRVIEIIRIARAEDGRALRVTIHILPSHLWRLSYSWRVGP